MLPYWLLFSVFAAGAMTYRLTPHQGMLARSPLFWTAIFAASVMVGLRYDVGGDWETYLEIFGYAERESWTQLSTGRSDAGYMLLNGITHVLGLDIWFVNVVCCLITMTGLTLFVRRQPNPWLAVVVAVPYFIIVVAMGYTRQAVAIGLIMASFGPFERRQYIRFALLFLAAASFHRTALVVLPLIALAPVKDRFVVYAAALALGAVAFSVFLGTFLELLFTNYLDQAMSSDGAGIRVAMNLLPAFLFLAFSNRFVLSLQERLIWRNFSIAALVALAGLFLLPSSTVVDRLALYLIPLQIFVLSRLPYAFPSRGERGNVYLMVGVVAYSAAIQLVWLSFATNSFAWLPYRMYLISN